MSHPGDEVGPRRMKTTHFLWLLAACLLPTACLVAPCDAAHVDPLTCAPPTSSPQTPQGSPPDDPPAPAPAPAPLPTPPAGQDAGPGPALDGGSFDGALCVKGNGQGCGGFYLPDGGQVSATTQGSCRGHAMLVGCTCVDGQIRCTGACDPSVPLACVSTNCGLLSCHGTSVCLRPNECS